MSKSYFSNREFYATLYHILNVYFMVNSNLLWQLGQHSLYTDYATGNRIQVLIPGRGKRFTSSSN